MSLVLRIATLTAAAFLFMAPAASADIGVNVSFGGGLPVVMDVAGHPVNVQVDFDRGVRRPYIVDRFGRRVFVDVVYDAWGNPLPMVYDVRYRAVPVLADRYVEVYPRSVVIQREVIKYKRGHGHHKHRASHGDSHEVVVVRQHPGKGKGHKKHDD